MQVGLERGLVPPETLRSFIELDSHPLLAAAANRYQGVRERLLADPRFLQRLFIEEAISITTSLIAQYERRRERFWSEIEYVATDIVRGAVVDFFTVWLPAPTLSFSSQDNNNNKPAPFGLGKGVMLGQEAGVLSGLPGWMGMLSNLPDNAFQRAGPGQSWGVEERVAAVILGGMKLFGVGFVSSIGTVGVTNGLMALSKRLKEGGGGGEAAAAAAAAGDAASAVGGGEVKRSPVVKTALVYASFLGTSANLRYQVSNSRGLGTVK